MVGIDPEEALDSPGGSFVRRTYGSLTGELMESATATVWAPQKKHHRWMTPFPNTAPYLRKLYPGLSPYFSF